MNPDIHINPTALIIAVVANFILGALWYMPLFGRAWAKEMKMDMTSKPPKSVMVRGMVIMVIGSFLMSFVFAHNIAVWDPTTWRLAPSTMSAGQTAGMAAFFTFLGFYLPQDLGRIAWENSSWKLFGINAGYHFLSLLITAFIFVCMK
jgi:hypothetical protein